MPIFISTSSQQLFDSNTTESLNWNNRTLYDKTTSQSISWHNRLAYDFLGSESLNWSTRTLFDTQEVQSVVWKNRALYDSRASQSLHWGKLELSGSWKINSTGSSRNNIVTVGQLNDMSSSFTSSPSVSSSYAATASHLSTTNSNWASVVGTITRGTINTETVTTGQLAEVVGALITDLKSSGILNN